jgi:hypothetical protein
VLHKECIHGVDHRAGDRMGSAFVDKEAVAWEKRVGISCLCY